MKCNCIVKNAYVVRIPRTWWMRLLPFAKHYHCTHCEAKFVAFNELQHDYGAKVRLDGSPDTDSKRVRRRVRAGATRSSSSR